MPNLLTEDLKACNSYKYLCSIISKAGITYNTWYLTKSRASRKRGQNIK